MQPGDSIGFFKLIEKVGHGGFGDVWMVKSTEDDKMYAMKLESLQSKKANLQFEASLLKKLNSSGHFPRFIIDGKDSNCFYLVEELLGPNLTMICDSFNIKYFERPFLPLLADEMLTCIEIFHSKGYVHRDIKPQNYVVRLDKDPVICLVDYGIARQYYDPTTKTHLTARDHTQTIGSPIYASPNTHDHAELSRRDDLYSWMYSILMLSDQKLPWAGETSITEMGRMKKEFGLSKLFEGFGQGFIDAAKHIESLSFEETPNYSLLHKAIQSQFVELNVKYQWMAIQTPPPYKGFKPPLNDPTGYLISISPHLQNRNHKGCYLI